MNNVGPFKVLSYHAAPYGESQLGFAVVSIKEKVQLIMKVCKSKQGGIFVCHPATKIDGSWVSTFTLANKDGEKKMNEAVLEQVKPLLNRPAPQPAQPPQQDQPYDDGLPF